MKIKADRKHFNLTVIDSFQMSWSTEPDNKNVSVWTLCLPSLVGKKSQDLKIIALEKAHHLILTFFVSPPLSLQLAVS